ncbi:hypothetical protein B0H67DRAFT_650334 [Lasiosphaeris hirsuta]|uniref:Uncharacterized protein n=1 Tax=Lasiosphaeris hirsuta TaxID=260670 RepID=A0AA40DI82_9PEZI|nr:hypothetical protein B0H67DRAFT_650334 [Lasiosphaeris hirsuta]
MILYYLVEIAEWENKLREIENKDNRGKRRPWRDYARSAEKMLYCQDDAREELYHPCGVLRIHYSQVHFIRNDGHRLPTADCSDHILTTAETTLQKLGCIPGFTAMFSIGLMWLTDAGTSRVQIFTATSVFLAVLVVFVQNQ